MTPILNKTTSDMFAEVSEDDITDLLELKTQGQQKSA